MSYTAKDGYSLIKQGEYEVQIVGIDFRETSNGKEFLSIAMKIRDDVDQPSQNRLLFDNIWREKDNPDYFNRKRVGSLLGTQGKDIEAESIEEVIEILEGSYLIAVVSIVHNDYTDMDENKVKYFKASKVGEQTLVSSEEEAALDISSDDLPF